MDRIFSTPFFVSLIVCSLILFNVSDLAFASGISLHASVAENPVFENHFFGAQIVQVMIDDPDAKGPDDNTVGLVVNGLSTQRVHLIDGRWYSFFAERDAFCVFIDVMTDGQRDSKIAVIEDGPDQYHLDPVACGTAQYDIEFNSLRHTFVREITQIEEYTWVEVDKLDLLPSLPDPFMTPINSDVELGDGHRTDWPYIRLFDFEELDEVLVRAASITASLIYDDFAETITSELDSEVYHVNDPITAKFRDFMWNINPVESDIIHWVFDKRNNSTQPASPIKILYKPTEHSRFADLLGVFALTEMGFDERQVLEITKGIHAIKFKQYYDALDDKVKSFDRPTLIREMHKHQFPVITVTERDRNSSEFITFDNGPVIFAGICSSIIALDYFDIINSAKIRCTLQALVSDN